MIFCLAKDRQFDRRGGTESERVCTCASEHVSQRRGFVSMRRFLSLTVGAQ